jgi:hypothetical protein
LILRIAIVIVLLLVAGLAVLYGAGSGIGGDVTHAGEAEGRAVAPAVVAERRQTQLSAAEDIGVARPKQILFGDLHVHTTFSFDAFQQSLPMAGGDGAHPVADACDYARHCAALDFWSINDHAVTLTPRRWSETVDSVRQCNEVAGNGTNPDLVSYLGWEWTQVGTEPANHWGHKNVIVRDLEDGAIPTRPISFGTPPGAPSVQEGSPGPFILGALALTETQTGGPDFVTYMNETTSIPDCPDDVPVRDLPVDCREVARTPRVLFDKLDDWGHETMVIPHGTTWGFYTSPGASWDKQLTSEQHDPNRQTLVEVFSGHGNSEEFRPFREALFEEDGSRSCPPPNENYLPSCWRAGEIIEERCLAEGTPAEVCSERAATARHHHVNAHFNGGAAAVPGTEVADWQDAGQCRDCFQPAFNYRPRNSVQYMMALGNARDSGEPERFRFGFIASSDNHSARPGTGYKEVARTTFTEQRFGNFVNTPLVRGVDKRKRSESKPVEQMDLTSPFGLWETERQASFFLNGGLAAVHSTGRDRDSLWEAMERKEVYGTSGPRILLWFDLLNSPSGRPAPMGSEVSLFDDPIFQVRAVGSFEQKPGCPADAAGALAPERIERLCRGECYHPSDRRRPITRIEVVRIRPQESRGEAIEGLVEDPWRVLPCPADGSGCQVAFSDPEFTRAGRDALYYVRAIEAPSPAVAANPLGCEYDESGRCVKISPCFGRPDEDECLSETEERAWSSPIFVNPGNG